MAQSLISIDNLFSSIFQAHPQINGRYKMGPDLNLSEQLEYPRIHIVPQSLVVNQNIVTHTLYMMCIDIAKQDDNEMVKEVWSDTQQILIDVVKFIRSYNGDPGWFDIANDPSMTPILEDYKDRFTGHGMIVQLQVDLTGPCDIPIFNPDICGFVPRYFTGQGFQGFAGTQGPQGLRGLQGQIGVQGNSGEGVQGNTGPQGNVGDIGPQGFQGQIGSGVQGFQGFQGFQGLQGLQGRQGLQGIQGVFGTTGVQGFQGLGNIGTTGLQGVQGWQGISGSETTLVAVTSSDFNTTSTSYVSVTGASVSLAANTNYNILVIGDWSSNNNSGQATFGITVPAGTSFTMIRMMGVASSAVTTNMQNTPDQSSLGAIGVGGSIRPFTMNIKLSTAGTAGAFQLRIASNNASYTATCTKNTLIEAKPY